MKFKAMLLGLSVITALPAFAQKPVYLDTGKPIEERVKHWYLKNCKAFVFPSIAEGFGLPVLEAMAYGKPVFLSRHTCLPEIGGDYAYYFNMDFDRELMQVEFKRGLEDYYGDVSRKAEEIKEYANRFSWENTARLYLRIYEEMVR